MPDPYAINACFLQQRVTGVARYAREISARLPGEPRLIAPAAGLYHLHGQAWEQLVLPRLVSPHEVLWSPANSGPLAVSRQVLTIHDLLPLDHPQRFPGPAGVWYRLFMPLLIQRVCAVLVVSEYLRQGLLEHFPHLPAERVIRVPPGVDLEQFRPVSTEETARMRKKFGLPVDYLLYVGAFEPSRNLGNLFEIWPQILRRYPGMRLALLGDENLGGQRKIHPSVPEGVQTLEYVSEQDLPALYSGALAFLFPNLDAGLGLPVLEAMACGAPVIAVNAGMFPEVVGDAGLLVDPRADALVDAACRLISDARLQADLTCRGLERVRQFTWQQAALAVSEVLRAV